MFKYYLKYIRGVQARNRYLRTLADMDPRTVEDVGAVKQDVDSGASDAVAWEKAMVASRFSAGWGLSGGWRPY